MNRRAASRARAARPSVGVRRAGVLSTIGLIVEGDAEYYAIPMLRSKYGELPPMDPINLGGVGPDRQPKGIGELVAPRVLQHVLNGRSRVVVVIDREDRATCPPDFAAQVQASVMTEYRKLANEAVSLSVVVADRAFESWILADARGLFARRVFRRRPQFVSFEGDLGAGGRYGKRELGTLLGRDYDERRDGPRLLLKVDLPAAIRFAAGQGGSRSLAKLVKELRVAA